MLGTVRYFILEEPHLPKNKTQFFCNKSGVCMHRLAQIGDMSYMWYVLQSSNFVLDFVIFQTKLNFFFQIFFIFKTEFTFVACFK